MALDWMVSITHDQECSRLESDRLAVARGGVGVDDKWDVRRVGKLIELFPGCVPAKYLGKQLTCYQADNEASAWMVEIDEFDSERDRDSLRQTMRM